MHTRDPIRRAEVAMLQLQKNSLVKDLIAEQSYVWCGHGSYASPQQQQQQQPDTLYGSMTRHGRLLLLRGGGGGGRHNRSKSESPCLLYLYICVCVCVCISTFFFLPPSSKLSLVEEHMHRRGEREAEQLPPLVPLDRPYRVLTYCCVNNGRHWNA